MQVEHLNNDQDRPVAAIAVEDHENHQHLANSDFFIDIYTAQRSGTSSLPYFLGLSDIEFSAMHSRYLRRVPVENTANELSRERGELRQQLLELRRDEWQDIYQLLIEHKADKDDSEFWLAAIVASGCLSGSHLWRSLGLPSREALKKLLMINFPSLAKKNDKNMRWKKFFYRQLCEQQGHYLCRAPSCEVCSTYQECFGDE